MFYIRTTKTASGSTAVQIVRYENRKKVIVSHIGSAHNREELFSLKRIASEWITRTSKQQALFPIKHPSSKLVHLDKCEYLGFRYGLTYEVINKIFAHFKFHLLENELLTDLVVARIAEPASKLRSLKLLSEYFGIVHGHRELYRQLPKFPELKSQIEAKVLAIAKKEFNFTFALVFYDVTTLYFESFEPDDLRKHGFSKDNKPGQPQILIGLLVSSNGFPVSYHIFEGNKFEGHTLLPVILSFKQKHKIDVLTVVADAAMISLENTTLLEANGIKYIVGARTGNLSLQLQRKISAQLNKRDGVTSRVMTDYGALICGFSEKRYRKDKREMERQIKKAEWSLKDRSAIKRSKFLKTIGTTRYALNTELIEKAKLLLGIKGYYTNLGSEVSDHLIILQYHNLWHVEQAFRIAKSDLEMRPIYHFKRYAIEAHILICFMALAVCKYMEIKTNKSTKAVVRLLKSVTDARILNTLNQEEIVMRSVIKDEVRQLLAQLARWY